MEGTTTVTRRFESCNLRPRLSATYRTSTKVARQRITPRALGTEQQGRRGERRSTGEFKRILSIAYSVSPHLGACGDTLYLIRGE